MQARKQIDSKNSRLPRWIWLAAALLLVVVVLVLFANREAPVEAQSAETVTAFIGDLSASASASGRVQAQRQVTLAFDLPGRVASVHVSVGEAVRVGDLLVQLDTADLQLNLESARQSLRLKEAQRDDLLEPPNPAELAAAEAAVASAQANLEQLLVGPSAAQVAASEAGLRAAEAALWSASTELSRVQSSVSEAQRLSAEAALLAAQMRWESALEANQANPTKQTDDALRQAEQALASAQAQRDALLAGPSPGNLGAAQGNLAAAQARLDGSRADLEGLLAGATPAQIASAESQLAQAQATLAALLAGAADQETVAAETEVAQARLALADAEDALASASLVAPFDGVVTALYAGAGEYAGGAVVEILDPDSLEVLLEVDEVDMGDLAIGQAALVTLETWPEEEIESKVLAIEPAAQVTPGSALVTFRVRLSLLQADLPVRTGMTANASLTTATREKVLLVPSEAINLDRQAGKYSVTLVRGDSYQEVEVSVGLHDDRFTQITSGLVAGDLLLVGNTVSAGADSAGAETPGGFFSGIRGDR